MELLVEERPEGVIQPGSGDLFLFDVNGRQHDVTGRLVPELHDPLAQVGVHHLQAVLLEKGIQVALLGELSEVLMDVLGTQLVR